jgi:hypothetical protein
MIEEVEFKDGYIRLKIKKESPDQKVLNGIRFLIPEYYDELAKNKELGKRMDAMREELQIEGWERAESRDTVCHTLTFIYRPFRRIAIRSHCSA